MRLYKRGKDANWTLDISHAGKRYVVSTKTINRQKANEFVADFVARLESGGGGISRQVHISFERLCELATTHYQVEGRRSGKTLGVTLRCLSRTFAGARATDITTERLERYKADRLVEDAAKATVNLELSALSLMFRLATEQKLLSTKPIVRLFNARDNVRQGFVSQGDYFAIRAYLTERYADYTDYLWWAGQRMGAACQLQWRDVDVGSGRDNDHVTRRADDFPKLTIGNRGLEKTGDARPGTIRIRGETTKTGIVQELPLVAGLAEVIARAAAYRSLICPYVFHWDEEHPINSRTADQAWHKAAMQAGLGHILIHDLRRSFVRNMLLAGMPFPVIKLFTGHQSDSILSRYAIMTTDDQANALERYSEYLSGQSVEPSVRKIR